MSDNLSTITDPFVATALDEETELRALSQALRLAQGFKLIFVRCNQPQQQKKLAAALGAGLPEFNVQEIHFDEPIMHLLDELRSRIEEPAPDAVFVSGLEYSLPTATDADSSPLVANLNASRNSFPQIIACPLVLWIPEYILNAIMLGAPDFFSIRSGVYFFAATPGDTIETARILTSGAEWTTANLTLAEKQERIDAIKSLLADYEALPGEQRDHRAEIRLHLRLGNLLFAGGLYNSAQKHYQQTLILAKELGDHSYEGYALGSLGNIYHAQGQLLQAAIAFEKSLKISREIDDQSSEGMALESLGGVYWSQERLSDAERACKEAAQIFRKLGDRVSEGSTLGNLGAIYEDQGQLLEAEAAYKQSLEIARELGDLKREANALNNFSSMLLSQGRLSEVEEALRLSLKIAREIGDPVHENVILRNHALLRKAQGDLKGAKEFARQAVEVLKKTEDVQELKSSQGLLINLEQNAEEQSKAETKE